MTVLMPLAEFIFLRKRRYTDAQIEELSKDLNIKEIASDCNCECAFSEVVDLFPFCQEWCKA